MNYLFQSHKEKEVRNIFISFYKQEGGKVRGESREMPITVGVTSPVEGTSMTARERYFTDDGFSKKV